jgi:hypothetical protein
MACHFFPLYVFDRNQARFFVPLGELFKVQVFPRKYSFSCSLVLSEEFSPCLFRFTLCKELLFAFTSQTCFRINGSAAEEPPLPPIVKANVAS